MLGRLADQKATADEFRRGRRGMGWSQEALARTLGVSPATLAAWENGETAIPPKVLAWVRLYVTAEQELEEQAEAQAQEFDLAA